MRLFSKLVREALAGDEVLISRDGKVVVRLLPDPAAAAVAAPRRSDAG
jgi:antitoxin (DNA-binding transcriptional repressor) of toxin-antitoxin stability system